MEEMKLERRYRSIYLAGPTFNLLADDETARRALHRIREHLAPDGQALIPLWVPGPTSGEEFGVRREAVDGEGATLVYTPLSETYDEALRTRTTSARYERLGPDGTLEQADRDWVLHWHSQASAREMCEQAGLRVVRTEDDNGNEATADADYFILIVQPS
ncbi:hypothetical protein [Kribbella sp. NPDC006257]|uniref:hypothetical protein n=1 Tax=Kribbella sp. NPDC006257 TaxID=3156738 RepID=UPI0033AD2006